MGQGTLVTDGQINAYRFSSGLLAAASRCHRLQVFKGRLSVVLGQAHHSRPGQPQS